MVDIKTVVFFVGTVIACSLCASSADKKPKTWKVVLIIAILTFVAGCRANTVGNDTMGYYYMFYTNGTYGYIRENMFTYYIKILMSIFDDANICILFSSLLTNALIISGFWKIRHIIKFKYNVIAYVCIPFFLTMSGLRQWLAIAIVVYFFDLLIQQKYTKFALAVAAASLFHTSVLIALMYLVIFVVVEKGYLKTGNKNFKRFLVAVAAIPVFYFVVRYTLSEYSGYLTNVDAANRGGSLMNIFRVIILVIYGAFSHVYEGTIRYKVLHNDNVWLYAKKQTVLRAAFWGYLFYVALCFVGQYVDNIARIAWPFLITQGFIFGAFDEHKADWGKVGKILCVILFVYYVYSTIVYDGNGLTPYMLFWE